MPHRRCSKRPRRMGAPAVERRGGGWRASPPAGRRPVLRVVAVCGGTRGPANVPHSGASGGSSAHATARPRAGARDAVSQRATPCIWGAEALARRARVVGWVDAAGVVHQSSSRARRRREHQPTTQLQLGGARACHAGAQPAAPAGGCRPSVGTRRGAPQDATPTGGRRGSQRFEKRKVVECRLVPPRSGSG